MELQHRRIAALPLIACLGGACQGQAEVARNEVPATAPQPAPLSPQQRAQQLVARRLGAVGNLTFADAQVFTNEGATVVCGRYQLQGQPPLRYITVGEEDVFVEADYSGDIGEAAAETCRNS